MTAPTGLTHIEQAKQHVRNARNDIYEKTDSFRAVQELIWAVDEVIRYVDPAPELFPRP